MLLSFAYRFACFVMSLLTRSSATDDHIEFLALPVGVAMSSHVMINDFVDTVSRRDCVVMVQHSP